MRPACSRRRGAPSCPTYNASSYSQREEKQAFESRLFDDLLEVHLELSVSESLSFDRFVTALGYISGEEHGIKSYRVSHFILFVSTRPNPGYRIRKVVCSLKRSVEPKAEYMFGADAKLVIEGYTAIWMFGVTDSERF